MRWVPVVGSVLVHLAILAPAALAVAHATAPAEQAERAAPVPRPADEAPLALEIVDVPLTEVVLLDRMPPALAPDPLLAPAPYAAPHAAPHAAPAPVPAAHHLSVAAPAPVVALAATDSAAATSAAPAQDASSTSSHSTGRSLLAMRGPEPDSRLSAPTGVMEHLAEGGHLPAPVHSSGELRDTGNGRAEVDDLVTTATVERDGAIHFQDKPNVDAQFHAPIIPTPSGIIQSLRENGKDIAAWYADPYEQTHYGKTQDLPRHLQAEDPTSSTPQCTSSGDLSCDDANAPQFEKRQRAKMANQIGFNGTFDLTAALMKKFHAGDAWEARKKKILADTFDERAQKGERYRGDQLDHASEIMRGNLLRLWQTTPGAAERKELLFAIWDECAEGEGPTGEAGERARAMVIGWIRSYLPAGSEGGYSEGELAQLSGKRTSKQAFQPY